MLEGVSLRWKKCRGSISVGIAVLQKLHAGDPWAVPRLSAYWMSRISHIVSADQGRFLVKRLSYVRCE